MVEKLDDIQSNFDQQLRELLCRTENVEKQTAENMMELEHHSKELERLEQTFITEYHDKKKENYSEFADKKGIYYTCWQWNMKYLNNLCIINISTAHIDQYG